MSDGLAYEPGVMQAVDTEIAQENLGLDPAHEKVRHKPSFFSRDRGKNIVFDTAVEVCRKGASEPYWVWVWERKDYGHRLPVGDAEEFHAKLEQVGADGAKGTMITPNGFEEGTIEYARSKGIGLWRYIPEGSLLCFMEDRCGVADGDTLRALTTQERTGFRSYDDFYGLVCCGELVTGRVELRRAELQDALEKCSKGRAALHSRPPFPQPRID